MLPRGSTVYINVSEEFVIVRKHLLLLCNNTNRMCLIQQVSHTEQRNCVHSEAMEMSKNVSRYATATPMWDTGCDFPGG
jgi:hypothetical protein